MKKCLKQSKHAAVELGGYKNVHSVTAILDPPTGIICIECLNACHSEIFRKRTCKSAWGAILVVVLAHITRLRLRSRLSDFQPLTISPETVNSHFSFWQAAGW